MPHLGDAAEPAGISQAISSRAGITLLLERLRQQHCLLAINVAGDGTTFSSVILEVEPQRRYFVLDALAPAAGNHVLSRDRQLHFAARSDGVDLSFRSKVNAIGEQSGTAFYRVPYPAEIDYHQKRQYRRAQIPLSQCVPILLRTEQGEIIRGELRDISTGGCSVRLAGSTVDLAERDILPRCVIALPAATRVTATVEICHSAPRGARRPQRIGARFYNLSQGDERRIAQFIAYLDRDRPAGQELSPLSMNLTEPMA